MYHHNSKTSCFGMENLPLTIEKDAFYDTKTTCFALRIYSAFMSSLQGRRWCGYKPVCE